MRWRAMFCSIWFDRAAMTLATWSLVLLLVQPEITPRIGFALVCNLVTWFLFLISPILPWHPINWPEEDQEKRDCVNVR